MGISIGVISCGDCSLSFRDSIGWKGGLEWKSCLLFVAVSEGHIWRSSGVKEGINEATVIGMDWSMDRHNRDHGSFHLLCEVYTLLNQTISGY